MKRRRRKSKSKAVTGEIQANFIRGFVATGLLTAFARQSEAPWAGRDVLRHALQGGAVLAAGGAVAAAIERREYTSALAAAVSGGAALVAVDQWLGGKTSFDSEN